MHVYSGPLWVSVSPSAGAVRPSRRNGPDPVVPRMGPGGLVESYSQCQARTSPFWSLTATSGLRFDFVDFVVERFVFHCELYAFVLEKTRTEEGSG